MGDDAEGAAHAIGVGGAVKEGEGRSDGEAEEGEVSAEVGGVKARRAGEGELAQLRWRCGRWRAFDACMGEEEEEEGSAARRETAHSCIMRRGSQRRSRREKVWNGDTAPHRLHKTCVAMQMASSDWVPRVRLIMQVMWMACAMLSLWCCWTVLASQHSLQQSSRPDLSLSQLTCRLSPFESAAACRVSSECCGLWSKRGCGSSVANAAATARASQRES